MASSDSIETRDGGPAFPWGEHGTRLGGLPLRDYFAAQAISDVITVVSPLTIEPESNLKLAQMAYAIADAMLKARGS